MDQPIGTEPRQALITFHGTLVYFDVVLRRLQHGRIGDVEANVYVTWSGSDTVLWWRNGESILPLGDFGQAACSTASDGGSTTLTATLIVPLGVV